MTNFMKLVPQWLFDAEFSLEMKKIEFFTVQNLWYFVKYDDE